MLDFILSILNMSFMLNCLFAVSDYLFFETLDILSGVVKEMIPVWFNAHFKKLNGVCFNFCSGLNSATLGMSLCSLYGFNGAYIIPSESLTPTCNLLAAIRPFPRSDPFFFFFFFFAPAI